MNPHHRPLLVGEVDTNGATTSGCVIRAGFPRGGTGGGVGHGVSKGAVRDWQH